MRIVALGGQTLVHGFALAGVDGLELEPGPEAEAAFDRLAADSSVAIIVVNRELFESLRERIGALRATRPLPVVISLPDRGEDFTPISAQRMLEEYIGVKL